ncbi:fibroblast growth factor receptor-like 1 [Stylophora pistillata]|uniref:fibroblast growth factor receptor-like 1 n=1 Tax=Stylophora pistillata TaxID=50429 RepID=UPI000C03F1DE|nr:fibroblast growth factor receptor-like 1 [Stylophora pistillata]
MDDKVSIVLVFLFCVVLIPSTAYSDHPPPRIQGTPKPQYVARLGDTKRLRCAVTGLPPPSITWIKNDQPLHQSERIKKLNEDKTIKIKGVRLEDRGNYTCIAENPLGKVNLTLQLHVRHDENLTATDSPSATKRPTTEHQARGKQADLMTNLKTTESTGAPVFSDPNLLKRSFRAWPASQSIRLKCQATGAPPLRYIWLKDGKDIKNRRLDPYVNASLWYLKLRDLVPADSGRYTCLVSNRYGSINHTFTLQVVARPHSAPILMRGFPMNKTVQVGDNATFTCNVHTNGIHMDFIWLKWTSMPTYEDILNSFDSFDSFRRIDPHYYKAVQVKSNYSLMVNIVNVTEDDFGLYICYVRNPMGKDFRSAYLIKYVKPMVPGTDKKTRNALVPGIVLACVLITVAVLTIICWRRRSNRIKKPLKPSVSLSETKFEYDAFVIFSSQDSDWVTKTLIPTLEEIHHFKCCVHYRDFVLGVPYRENMVNSVYKSRKTIAVVSKNFFKSNYCCSEMEYALHRLMERRDDSVVVIKLDEVNREKIPKELRKRSYIDYAKKFEKHHWERKLVDCLTIPNDQPQEQVL